LASPEEQRWKREERAEESSSERPLISSSPSFPSSSGLHRAVIRSLRARSPVGSRFSPPLRRGGREGNGGRDWCEGNPGPSARQETRGDGINRRGRERGIPLLHTRSTTKSVFFFPSKNQKDRPRIGRHHPPDLSISLSGGKETNQDSPSSGERSGRSPSP